MTISYFDFINTDVAYIIFTYIDDLIVIKSLQIYTSFRSILISPYSYINKLQDNYPELMYNPLDYIKKYINTPLEYADLSIDVFLTSYIGLKRSIDRNIQSFMIDNMSVSTYKQDMRITSKDLIDLKIINKSDSLIDYEKNNRGYRYILTYFKNNYILEIINHHVGYISSKISKIQAFNISIKLNI